jgi:hypothetical protein
MEERPPMQIPALAAKIALRTACLAIAFTIGSNLVNRPIVNTPSKLLLIDGHSLAFRSYYAFAKGREGGLRTSTGIPTSVCFGFLKSLIEVISVEKPTYLAIAFDLGGPTYRHDADETYKAGRAETLFPIFKTCKNY